MNIHSCTRILAIDPGTKEMGVAVFQGHALIDHGVKIIKRGRSPQETLSRGMAIVTGLMEDFRPEILVIEKVFIGRNRNAALLNIFADEINALAKRDGIVVLSFAANAVKKAICGYGWATKADVAKAVTVRYPELKAYLFKDRKWKERFHANMFDAVALGMMVT
jgi:Holliday junction resolvasome RuvABC endonuclease subunit